MPMLCVGKRWKKQPIKSKAKQGQGQDEGGSQDTCEATEEVKTDHIKSATEILGYDWCAPVQQLFE